MVRLRGFICCHGDFQQGMFFKSKVFVGSSLTNDNGKMCVMPMFERLVLARRELIEHSRGLVQTLNVCLSTLVSKPVQDQDPAAERQQQAYVNAQTQTGTVTTKNVSRDKVVHNDDDYDDDDDGRPSSYHALRRAVDRVRALPGTLSYHGSAATGYAASDLAMLVTSLPYAAVAARKKDGSQQPVEAERLQQARKLAAAVKDDIRGLKSIALTL
ncbi:hypothetical protein V1514DRAFT_333370 [Lipomyces japonicus]|uniref:uncharacterized protein n=1 Tax=Lipomyces japonicus TaxID=56871 RepID=UPI0034CF25A1